MVFVRESRSEMISDSRIRKSDIISDLLDRTYCIRPAILRKAQLCLGLRSKIQFWNKGKNPEVRYNIGPT